MPANSVRSSSLLVSALAGTAFVLLAVAVVAGWTIQFDTTIRSTVHAGATPFLTLVATGASFLGRLLVLIPACAATVAYLVLKKRRAAGLALVGTMGGALTLNWVAKAIVHRPRPHPFYGVDPESLSFPSGHVFFTTCFCCMVALTFYRHSKLSYIACAIFISTVAWSRVYLGVHYPTDVVAGLLAGLFWLGALFGTGFVSFDKLLLQHPIPA